MLRDAKTTSIVERMRRKPVGSDDVSPPSRVLAAAMRHP